MEKEVSAKIELPSPEDSRNVVKYDTTGSRGRPSSPHLGDIGKKVPKRPIRVNDSLNPHDITPGKSSSPFLQIS